ncbi:MAG TPA: N-acetylmuramoyl-L-alanine amidase [Firmicutes bacterium]|nr:N-acetylmuramoyl-L-alanine amidase [Bacillota bacterium]
MPYVVIDSGHGGYDKGASYFGYNEKDITLRVAKKVASRLKALGFDVKLLRETDEYLGNASERGRMIAELKPDFAISIHVNSSGGEGKLTGAEIITPLGKSVARFEYYLREGFEKLNKFRQIYSRISGGEVVERFIDPETIRYTKTYDSRNYYGIIREAWNGGVPLDIVEMFYIDNEGDLYTFLNQEDKYVEAIVRAMAKAFNITYREEVTTQSTHPTRTEYAKTSQVKKPDTYYRVVCGSFYAVEDAKRMQQQLLDDHYEDVWVQQVPIK